MIFLGIFQIKMIAIFYVSLGKLSEAFGETLCYDRIENLL